MPDKHEALQHRTLQKGLHPVLAGLLSAIFLLAGVAAAIAAVCLGIRYKDATLTLLTPPDSARTQLVATLDVVCQGDYGQANGTFWVIRILARICSLMMPWARCSGTVF